MVFKLQDNGGNLSGKEFVIFGRTIAEMKQASAEGERFGGIFKSKVVLPVKNAEKIIENYNKAVKNSTLDQDIFNKVVAKDSLTKHLQTLKGAPATLDKYTASLSAMTLKAHAAAFGMQALKLAGNMALMFIVSELISIPFRIAEANKKIRTDTIAAAEAFKESTGSIEGYKAKITELRTALDSGNLSQGEAYDKRKELISIQGEIIDKYGAEASSIDVVNDSLKKQIESFDALSVSMASSELTKNAKGNTKAIEKIETNKMYNLGLNISEFVDGADSIIQLVERFKDDGVSLDSNGDNTFNIRLHADAKDAKQTLLDFNEEFNKLKVEPNAFGNVNEFIATSMSANEKILADYQQQYDTYNMQRVFVDKDNKGFDEQYVKATTALKVYNEAVASGDSEKTKTSLDNLQKIKAEALTMSAEDVGVTDFFQNLFSGVEDALTKHTFKVSFEANTDNLKTEVSNALSDLEGLDDQGILNIGQIEGTKEQEAAYNSLCKSAKKYHIEIEDLIALLVKWGLVQGEVADAAANAPTISPISNSFKALADDMDKVQSAYQTMSSAINDYNKNGYLTIDNMQAIMALGDDYIGLLFNENGQIKLNKEGYIALANAQLDEMEAKALATAINNVQALKDEATATEYLTGKTKESTKAIAEGNDELFERIVQEKMLAGGDIALATQQIATTFNQYKTIIDTTRSSLGRYTDATMGATDATKDLAKAAQDKADALLKAQGNAAIKSLDKRIDGLQKQLTLLDKQYEAEDALLALEKAKDAYENTKNQKTQRVYYEDRGLIWEANQGKLAEAQESIKNLEKEQARKNAKKAMQDEIDKLQDLKKKYQESMSHIGETLEEHMLEMELMAQFDGMSYEQMATYSDDYTARVIANLNAEAAAIANRNAVAASGATSSYNVSLPDGKTVSFDNKSQADQFYDNADMHYGDGVKKKYKTGGVNDYTGLAQLDGSPNSVETIFNATDGKKLYDAIHNVPDIGALLMKNSMPNFSIRIPEYAMPKSTSINNNANSQNPVSYNFSDFKIVANKPEDLFDGLLNYAKIHSGK